MDKSVKTASKFKVVIPSATASNLKACTASIFTNEPGIGPENILVVDDGVRANWPDAPVTWISGAKPFVFARNANLGIVAAHCDVILINDDATLETLRGFSVFADFMAAANGVGPCSAAVEGVVGNCNQRPKRTGGFRSEKNHIAFVCVYISWRAYNTIGPLDERFVGYGKDDRDYCERARKKGLDVGIYDPCIVRHGILPSTYRTRPDIAELCRMNLRIYNEKKAKGACDEGIGTGEHTT